MGDSATLVRNRRLGVRRVGRVLLDAADEVERGVERFVILRIRWDVGLRAGLLVAFGLEVAAQLRDQIRLGSRGSGTQVSRLASKPLRNGELIRHLGRLPHCVS